MNRKSRRQKLNFIQGKIEIVKSSLCKYFMQGNNLSTKKFLSNGVFVHNLESMLPRNKSFLLTEAYNSASNT